MAIPISVTKAKIHLMLNYPFFGSLIVRLQLKEWDTPTFATDGRYIFVPPPEVVKTYNFRQQVAVLAHEVLHCVLLHPFRMQNRHQMKWNVACDYADNLILEEQRFELGKGWLLNHKYKGWTAEKIYNSLPESTQKMLMDLIPGMSEAEAKELADEWKDRVAVAAQKCRGNLPGGLEEMINEILFPKIPWQEVLYKYLEVSKGCSDYTTYPFNRRHVHREIYLPSMTGDSIDICVGLDTSGSISSEQLRDFLSEVRGICSIFGDYTIHLFQCDAKVQKEHEITADGDVPQIVFGRGGTSFVPVFERIEELELDHLPLIYFTDLDGEFPKNPNRNEVFWVVRKEDKKNVPFGHVIVME